MIGKPRTNFFPSPYLLAFSQRSAASTWDTDKADDRPTDWGECRSSVRCEKKGPRDFEQCRRQKVLLKTKANLNSIEWRRNKLWARFFNARPRFLPLAAPPDVAVEKTWVHAAVGAEAELVCVLHSDPNSDVSEPDIFNMSDCVWIFFAGFFHSLRVRVLSPVGLWFASLLILMTIITVSSICCWGAFQTDPILPCSSSVVDQTRQERWITTWKLYTKTHFNKRAE